MTNRNQENRNHESDFSSDSDKEVSAMYRASSTESPPRWLDDNVLRQAAAAARASRPGRLFFSFRRPLTFVAVLALSLAMVLQFDEELILGNSDLDQMQDQTEAAMDQSKSRRPIGSAPPAIGSAPPAIGGTAAIRRPNARHCENTEEKTADAWWECILQLELDGRADDASAERELMMRAFPDFTPPQ